MKKKQPRLFDDGCAAAHGLALVGDRWALLVVRQLILGPKRFTDLRAGLQAISPNVLTQRLEGLERAAVVQRRRLPPPASAWVYELTEWGQQLEPVILSLGRWAARSPFLPQGTLNTDSLILSFRTMFHAPDLDGTIELRVGDERFRVNIRRGKLELVRGEAPHPDAIIEGDSDAFVQVAYAGAKFPGDLKIDGDKSIARRFLSAFPLPERAPANPASEASRR
jgi:DNA-binding HxlR family transcriptional regulator